MKAACWYGWRDVRIEEVASRDPPLLEVSVRFDCAVICATEVPAYTGRPQIIPMEPQPMTGRWRQLPSDTTSLVS